MDILIAYYSRTKHTEKVANLLAEKFNADLLQIIDEKRRSGFAGYILGGRDALEKAETKIKYPLIDISKYDLVILGTPVWAWTMTPAIRTFININRNSIKKFGVFALMQGSGAEKTISDIEKLMNGKSIISLPVTQKEISSELFQVKISNLQIL